MIRSWFLRGVLSLLAVSLSLPPARTVAQQKEPVRIAFVVDGPWERNDEILDLFRTEISEVLSGDFGVLFPPELVLQGDFTPRSVHALTDRLLRDSQADLIITMGVLASADAGRRTVLPKPVIAPFVLDSRAQGIPLVNGTCGIENLSYIESPSLLERELQTFQEVVPFQRLALLTNPFFVKEMGLMMDNTRQVAEDLGIDIEVVAVAGTAEEALSAVPEDAQAAYLVPLLQLGPGEFDRLVSGLHDRGLPTFSFFGRRDVERGVLAGLASDEWLSRLARRVALNAQRILLGEDAGTLPVSITRREDLVINMKSARDLGVYPSFRIQTEATLINQVRTEVSRRISLLDAVREAMSVNRDLAAGERSVEGSGKEIARARAELLPQVDLSAVGTVIDEDRAASSFGSAQQRSLRGRVGLRQILWSEKAWANLNIQKNLHESRERDLEQLRLDVALDAAAGYLDLLRAKTFEQIQKDNLKLSRSNYELAQIRRSIGVSGPSEVYRWQSRIASEQKSVIEANALRNLAEIALNRLLHRPLEESFLTVEADLDDPALITSDERFLDYFSNPSTFRRFRKFMAQEALDNSPEIRSLEASIEGQGRLLRSARRSFFSPTVALTAEVSTVLAEGGAGSDFSLPAGLGAGLEETDDTDWNVSLSLSIPLANGGGRIADVQQSARELEALRIQKESAAERIEQRMRSALHIAGASYAGIALSRESADAARRNLDLVQDAYSKGAVQIIDLLDAQNASLIADQATANAVYDFLIDLMEVERAVGRFEFFVPEEEREAWFQRLDAYLESTEGEAE